MFRGFRWGLEITCLGSRLRCRLRCGHLDLVLEAAPEMWRLGSMGVDRSSRSPPVATVLSSLRP